MSYHDKEQVFIQNAMFPVVELILDKMLNSEGEPTKEGLANAVKFGSVTTAQLIKSIVGSISSTLNGKDYTKPSDELVELFFEEIWGAYEYLEEPGNTTPSTVTKEWEKKQDG